jgi:hypothetical protein
MLVPLRPFDPDVVVLAYHQDVKTLDPKEFPTYQLGQICSNVGQENGEDGSSPYCDLFRGKVVAANGWYKAWARRPLECRLIWLP